MAQVPSPVAALEPALTGTDRSFLWRRLHSLSGVLPVGFFLLFHIFENMAAIRGPEAYDEGIAKLTQLFPAPYFYVVEIAAILVPIAYHGFYGLFLSFEAKPNVGRYPYRRNYSYLLQRITGVFALVFLLYHILSLRIAITLFHRGSLAAVPGYVGFADVARHYADNWVLAFYVLGTLSAAHHFGNGLNGFCWTWGIAVGERSRKVVELISWVVFLATALPMLHILWSFRR